MLPRRRLLARVLSVSSEFLAERRPSSAISAAEPTSMLPRRRPTAPSVSALREARLSSAPMPVGGAADCAASHGHAALAEALRASAKWAEPSRFLRDASAERTRAALRGGADIVTLPGEPLGSAISPPRFAEMCSLDGPSRMYALGVLGAARAEKFAEAGSVAALVRAAAAPWSTSSHELFPDQARADPKSHHLNSSLSSLNCVSDGVPVSS